MINNNAITEYDMISKLHAALVEQFTEAFQSDLIFHSDGVTIYAVMEYPDSCGYSSQLNNVSSFIRESERFKNIDVYIDGDYEKEFTIDIIE